MDREATYGNTDPTVDRDRRIPDSYDSTIVVRHPMEAHADGTEVRESGIGTLTKVTTTLQDGSVVISRHFDYR